MRGVPQSAMDCTLASISDSTWKQYNYPLKLWWLYSKENNVSCFAPQISQVLEFLAECLDKVKKYGTMNNYRSALSLLIGNDLGKNPTIPSKVNTTLLGILK